MLFLASIETFCSTRVLWSLVRHEVLVSTCELSKPLFDGFMLDAVTEPRELL